MYSYIPKMKYATIRVRDEESDFSQLPDEPSDWGHSIHGNAHEEIHNDTPKPLGKCVVTTHYVDTNLYDDIMIWRSVTGILHLMNKTPLDWYSKK